MKRLRIMSLVEGTSLTGPIRPLLGFSRYIADEKPDWNARLRIITTVRGTGANADSNEFIDAAHSQGTGIDVVTERHALDTAIIPKILALIDMHQPDIVETHSFKPHFVMSLIRRRLQQSGELRWIAFHHGYTRETFRVRLYNQFDRWSLRQADRVITLCRPFADSLVRHRGVAAGRISVIKNAIEARRPAPEADVAHLRDELGIEAHERVILCVGRLSPEKGHADLVRAFATLVRRRSATPLRLVMVGDGVERRALTALSNSLGARTLFAGQRRDVGLFYGLASVVVLPSHSEGSPMVLLEAMMAGRPVVATAVGGIPEMVTDDRSALLVPAHSPESLCAAIERLLLDDNKASAITAAAAASLDLFSMDHYSDSLMAIYRAALAAPCAAG